MQGYKTLFRNISTYDIADFDNRNHSSPYPQPPRNMNYGQQLKQRYNYKKLDRQSCPVGFQAG
jgi:hypothetical protein